VANVPVIYLGWLGYQQSANVAMTHLRPAADRVTVLGTLAKVWTVWAVSTLLEPS
jgi:hypothetical protein